MSWAIYILVFTPIDNIMDIRHRNHRVPWNMPRRYVNKYELAAKYPHMEEKIVQQHRNPEALDFAKNFFEPHYDDDSDEIPLLYFWHPKSNAVPEGRQTLLCAADCILEDGPLQYEEPPLRTLAHSNIIVTPFAFTPASDLLAPPQAPDTLASIILSNQQTFGVGNILSPKGGDFDRTQLATALNLIEYSPRPPP